jgi:hypothetical protein
MPKLTGAHDAPVQKRGTGRSLTRRRRRGEGGIVNARLNVGFARGPQTLSGTPCGGQRDAFLARHTCRFNRSSTSKKG